MKNRAAAPDLVRKVAETFTTRIFIVGLGLVTSVMVARILGPEGRGLYALVTALAAVGVQLGNLGLHSANTYYVARNRCLLSPLVGNTLLVGLSFGILCGILTWTVSLCRPGLIPVNGPLLVLALAWVPCGLAYMLLQNLLLGIEDVRTYNKIELANSMLGVGLLTAVIGCGAVRVETVFAAGLAALALSALWAFRSVQRRVIKFPRPSPALLKECLLYGLKAYFAVLCAFLVLRVDIFIVNHYLGAEQTGLYSIAVALTNMVNLFPTVVSSIIFPQLCAMQDWQAKFQLVKGTALTMAGIMLPGIALAMVFAKPVITLLYGPAFTPSAVPFMWLMPGALVWSIESVARKLLTSDGYRTGVLYAWFLALVLNIVLNLFFIPQMGIKGAALASSMAFTVVAGITWVLIWKDWRIHHV